MNVLVACEESQRVTIEFRKLGHKAYSCDLLDRSGNHPEWHIKKDVTLLLNGNCIFNTVDGLEHEISGKWDMIIAFPPCTYLTVTANRWYNYEKYGDKAIQRMLDRYEAIINPEWHHVSLATLANIDNDMLDEKRRHYMKVYRMTANVINSIYKCNKLTSIDKLRTNLIQTVRTMAKNEKIEWALVQYVKAKIDNCYLVNGLQSSFYSKTYGHNKSRSYTKTFFI